MSDEQPPWWASGAEDLSTDDDPFDTYRAARAGESTDTGRAYDVPWEDWDRRDPPPPAGAQRSAFEDVMEGMQALARAVAARRGDPDRRSRGGGGGGGRAAVHDPTCSSCPWCITMRSLGDARPEVVEHLDEAMRHVVAAARAWVESAEQRGGWEKIELDDEEPR